MKLQKTKPIALLLALLCLCSSAVPALATSTADAVFQSAVGIGTEALSIWNSLLRYYFDAGNRTALITLGVSAAVLLLLIFIMLRRRKRFMALLLAVVMIAGSAWGIPAIFGDNSQQAALTPEALLDETDSDGEGLADALEKLLGTDPAKPDTDGDGLSDLTEVQTGTDPLQADSDGNGISDAQEDADSDGLNAAEELALGTNAAWADTDNDGLNDGDEARLYGTDPLNADTDGDGASDGFEVAQGTDPLTAQTIFNVRMPAETDEATKPSVEITLRGEQADTLSIVPASASLLTAEVPGAMGSAYSFTVEGEFDSAVISFAYDPASLPEDGVPVIAYYNEETQELELLETTVADGVASAVVSHFSTYILLNRTAFDQVWDTEIKPPIALEDDSELPAEMTLDIVFVIDYSGSMEWNDPEQLCKTVSHEFIAKLRDGLDRAAAVKFIRTATLIAPLGSSKDEVNAAIDGIVYDDGYDRYSDTNGSEGLNCALNELSASTAKYKYIIHLTDGEDTNVSYSYADLCARAVSMGVNIYTVGMGSASEEVLKDIAFQTSGKYYHATAVMTTEDVVDLDQVFTEIEAETIDYTADSNNDSISDYYTRLLCEGRITYGTGLPNPFYANGFTYEEVQQTADLDGDGLKNGDELVIYQSQHTGRVYCFSLSNPVLEDTDSDGYKDGKDPNPMLWNVSDRDLALATTAVYVCIPVGYEMDSLPAPMRSQINNSLTGTKGLMLADVAELKGWQVVDAIYEGTAQMMALRRENSIIVAFRGTEPMSNAGSWDWLQDWDNNVSTVLLGLSKYAPICKSFITRVMLKNPGCDIYVTGHSLGGNLTYNAAAMAIALNGKAVKRVTTFNGLGLALGLTLFNDAVDEALLLTKQDVICNYSVSGDPVSTGILGSITYHYGETKPYALHEQAGDAHALYNFFESIEVNGRFTPRTVK